MPKLFHLLLTVEHDNGDTSTYDHEFNSMYEVTGYILAKSEETRILMVLIKRREPMPKFERKENDAKRTS